MTQLAEKTLKAIDEKIVDDHTEKFRRHLGASIIGRPCIRSLWYSFRWAKPAEFSARILRLFQRGHLEEDRFIDYLTRIGCKVWSHDADGNQFRFSFCGGHAGGSLDSVATGVPDVPKDRPCLCEYKTHNDKSFKMLQKKGVKNCKFEHYVQMQLYMSGFNLPYALYMAVNKNDDDLYLEIVTRNDTVANVYKKRAENIVYAETPPARLNESPGWWQCSWCDYKQICHTDAIATVNCRTCANSTPVADGDWSCERHYTATVDHANYKKSNEIHCTGCGDHIYLPGMIGGATLVDMADNRSWIKYKLRNGNEIVNGRDHIKSIDLLGD
jgi:hypothetical protein